jgi:NAD(P)-dependent dehydrogenase (short-subunit alcohol dehydrogenase family)
LSILDTFVQKPTPLAHQTALITGAGAGIGLAIAQAFCRAGASVILMDLDAAGAEHAAAQLRAEGADARAIQGSVACSDDVERVFAAVDGAFGLLDILVNNAGVAANMPTLELSDEAWDNAIAVNLRGAFLCARAAGKRMVAQGHGVIINTASIYGVVAAPNRLAYCASKSALCMMTKALALEWGPAGVRVNAVAPGYVRTALVERLVEEGKLDLAKLAARTPLGRLAEAEEIADAALMLCTPNARFITGQILGVDGGWTANGYL